MARKTRTKSIGQYEPHKQLSVRFDQDVSDHATELLWGQGFEVSHSNEIANTRLQELLKYNKANEQFSYNEKTLSLLGNTYWTIDLVNGNPTWTMADPYLNSTGMNGLVSPNTIPTQTSSIYGMGRAMVTDVVAVIWKRITFGTINFPVKEVWDTKKVKRYFYGSNEKQVTIAAVNKQIPKELQLTEEWEHNMGFVPVIWFKNVPTFNGLSWRDGYKGDSIQDLANHTLSQQWYETATNRTRIFGSMNEDKYAELVKSGALGKLVTQDLLVNVPQKNSTGDEANALVPIQGDPKLDIYTQTYNAMKDEYFKLAGYSPLGDGNTEKTATENLLMKTGDYQTTKKKRNQRYQEIGLLLKYTMLIDAKWGFGNIYGDVDKDFSFTIKENKVMDSLQEMQNWALMVDNGFASRVEAIAAIRGVTKQEAMEIHKEITDLALKEQQMGIIDTVEGDDTDEDE